MKKFPYRIVTEWNEPDAVYVARVPAFPGCAAHGDTPGEAAKEAIAAAEGMLAILADDGKEAPPSDLASEFSGQLRLRLPVSVHRQAAIAAEIEGVSLNTLLGSFIASSLSGAPRLPASKKTRATGTPRQKARRR